MAQLYMNQLIVEPKRFPILSIALDIDKDIVQKNEEFNRLSLLLACCWVISWQATVLLVLELISTLGSYS